MYILMGLVALCILFFLYMTSYHSNPENTNIKSQTFISQKRDFDQIYDRYITENYKRNKNRKNSFSNPIVSIKAFPVISEPNFENKLNYTITWISTNTSMSENSWIGIYPYSQETGIFNCISFISRIIKKITRIKN